MDYYPARFESDGDGFLVTFPDVPEAITGGKTLEEALSNAQDALEVALLAYADQARQLPVASRHAPGRSWRRIAVPAAIVAKIAFIEAFRKSGLTRVALAAKLSKGETEIRRMLDPYHRTKLPALESGLRALGKRLVVTVEEAA